MTRSNTRATSTILSMIFCLGISAGGCVRLPNPENVKLQHLFTVPNYCEGVVFDHDGFGYISHGKSITRFSPDGNHVVWAETGAPNGHKILADGTHLVCDASHHAILHLSADGKMLDPAATECDGVALRSPNDIHLDTPNGGFYFTDPGSANAEKPDGTIHYVDAARNTFLVDDGLIFPNGIALDPSGRWLLVAESIENLIYIYDVLAPGKTSSRRVFAKLPVKNPDLGQITNKPDGVCVDFAGNLYVAHYGMKQVHVLDLNGKIIRSYDGGNLTTSNVAFGGPNMDQLYITGGLGPEDGEGGLFQLDLVGVQGLVILPPKK